MWLNQMAMTSPFEELRRQVDRLFDGLDLGLLRAPIAWPRAYPAMNVWDAGDTLCVEAEVPGIRNEDLEVFAVGDELTIKGRRPPVQDEQRIYHRQERTTGESTRVITLPAAVDADRVEAVLKDGVLTVRLPKAEAAKPRKIALTTN